MWLAAHSPVPGVPRWARIAAVAVPFTALPASVWRIAVCTLHAPIAPDSVPLANAPSGIPGLPLGAYVVLLSIVSELLAFTAVGLVARWGEFFPGWLPFLRRRRVPVLVAVVPAATGAVVLTALWTWTAVAFAFGRRVDGSAVTGPTVLELHDWQGWIAVLSYAPLLLWGPLLGALTVAYWLRRRRSGTPLDLEASTARRLEPAACR